MDELLRPDMPLQTQTTGISVHIGLHSLSKSLKKSMETEQWEIASQALSYIL